jgi:hypothetical protein
MKITVQLVVEYEDGEEPIVEEIGCLCRGDLLPETLGLTLDEGKAILARIQKTMVAEQAAAHVEQQRACPQCGKRRVNKGNHVIVYRSLFGKLRIQSPRLYACSCRRQDKKSFSPLAEQLPERMAPEFRYLQSKWASLMSYGLTVDLLEDVLPLQTNVMTVIRNTHHMARKLESELGDERLMFADACQAEWEKLPMPAGRITVGMDGGYIHARDGNNRKAGWFEAIAGKSITDEGDAKCFSFVNTYDEKRKRRLFEVLNAQGLQSNQDITFLSDGGDTVRQLQYYLSPQSEHVLDWFHVTMRLTVMKNTAKGLPDHSYLQNIIDDLDRVKWYLWHGNVYQALEIAELIEAHLEGFEADDATAHKLWRAIQDFRGYIANNAKFIPNYGERYRYGEIITTAFVESTINWVVSKRMVKKQQMRWTQEGAHLLLQVRTKTLNEELRDTFCRWYPGMTRTIDHLPLAV